MKKPSLHDWWPFCPCCNLVMYPIQVEIRDGARIWEFVCPLNRSYFGA